jgi:hypothetical protein
LAAGTTAPFTGLSRLPAEVDGLEAESLPLEAALKLVPRLFACSALIGVNLLAKRCDLRLGDVGALEGNIHRTAARRLMDLD